MIDLHRDGVVGCGYRLVAAVLGVHGDCACDCSSLGGCSGERLALVGACGRLFLLDMARGRSGAPRKWFLAFQSTFICLARVMQCAEVEPTTHQLLLLM